MGSNAPVRHHAALAVSLALLVIVPVTLGCLSDEPAGEDLDEWHVAMIIERFETNGQHVVNVTELLFKVRFGPVDKDTWLLQESNGFVKGQEDIVPIRIEARYDDGSDPVEDFPILGSSNVLTGALKFKDGKMSLVLDGDNDLHTIDRSIDRYPHDHEITATIYGDYGDLVLYFNLNEPY